MFFVVLTLIGLGAVSCEPPVPEGVAVIVNKRPITMAALDAAVLSYSGTDADTADPEEIKRRALDDLIEEELILSEAERLNINVSGTEFNARLKEIMDDYPGDSFNRMLVREYADLDTFKDRLSRNLLIQKTTREVLADQVRIDPEEEKKFVEKNEALNFKSLRFFVLHLTLATREDAEKAEKLIQSGKSFEEAAMEVLEKPAGGKEKESNTDEDSDRLKLEPVWVYPELLPKTIAEAITGLKPGMTSPVVTSEYGFSIFRVLQVEERNEADEVRMTKEAEKLYVDLKTEEAFDEWISVLRSKAIIVPNPSLAHLVEQGKNL